MSKITENTSNKLMERIESISDLSAFRRLLIDFDDFLTPELRKRVIFIAREVFGEYIIAFWNIEI